MMMIPQLEDEKSKGSEEKPTKAAGEWGSNP